MADPRWSRPREIRVDARTFRDYVLDPAKANGKDGVFLGLLGFRERHGGDAAELAEIYERHAIDAVARDKVRVGTPIPHGMRCTKVVTVRGVAMRSGWLLDADGVLRLVTPFSGFAPGRKGSR